VVLRPGPGADLFDRALAGQIALVESIEQDIEGLIQLAVVVEDDPGRDLGIARRPGHRFFFKPEEVEPLVGSSAAGARVLIAGIGNIFLADDGFGVEVARRLAERELPPGVRVGDFGIRGLDLVYALGEGYDGAIFVDAVPRGEPPGTLFVIEPDLLPSGEATLDAHGMDPVKVLALAREIGEVPERLLILGCEPQVRMTGDEAELVGELSGPVHAAVGPAVEQVESLVDDLLSEISEERKARR
jgi:hydrogenase maturation protease